jgi:hypothetical protein
MRILRNEPNFKKLMAATTVSRYENGSDAYGDTLNKIKRALEAGGIIFLDENGEGPGVRLKKRRRNER